MLARQVESRGHFLMAGLIRIVAALLLLCGMALAEETATADNPFLPTLDARELLAAIERGRPPSTAPSGVTGITVPHHLLAADLIARGFWAALGGQYTRIILISPDHFHKVSKGFATVREDLVTVLGTVPSDQAGCEAIAQSPLVEVLPTVDYEHGVMAVAPFIAHFFPGVAVIRCWLR